MLNSNSDSTVRKAAIGTISFYRKHLSPRKGFNCAHRVLHGGESCSERVLRAVQEEPLGTALGTTRQQFKDCAQANRTLRNTRGNFRCIVLPCCIPF